MAPLATNDRVTCVRRLRRQAVALVVTLAWVGLPSQLAEAAAPAPPAVANVTSAAALGSIVISPTSDYAYFTVPSQNEVAVLDLITEKFTTPLPVGSKPADLDVTANGKFLYVTDTGGDTISRVNLSSGKVSTIFTPAPWATTAGSIVVLGNGVAVYTTGWHVDGGWSTIYELNLKSGSTSVIRSLSTPSPRWSAATALARSGNRSTIGLVSGEESTGHFAVATGSNFSEVVTGILRAYVTSVTLDQEGTVMVVDGSEAEDTYVIDAKDGHVRGSISGTCIDVALNASGSRGYCLETTSIVEMNMKTLTRGKELPFPSGTTGDNDIAMSPNGHFLVTDTDEGAAIVDLNTT